MFREVGRGFNQFTKHSTHPDYLGYRKDNDIDVTMSVTATANATQSYVGQANVLATFSATQAQSYITRYAQTSQTITLTPTNTIGYLTYPASAAPTLSLTTNAPDPSKLITLQIGSTISFTNTAVANITRYGQIAPLISITPQQIDSNLTRYATLSATIALSYTQSDTILQRYGTITTPLISITSTVDGFLGKTASASAPIALSQSTTTQVQRYGQASATISLTQTNTSSEEYFHTISEAITLSQSTVTSLQRYGTITASLTVSVDQALATDAHFSTIAETISFSSTITANVTKYATAAPTISMTQTVVGGLEWFRTITETISLTVSQADGFIFSGGQIAVSISLTAATTETLTVPATASASITATVDTATANITKYTTIAGTISLLKSVTETVQRYSTITTSMSITADQAAANITKFGTVAATISLTAPQVQGELATLSGSIAVTISITQVVDGNITRYATLAPSMAITATVAGDLDTGHTATYDGIKIKIPYTSNWVGVAEVRATAFDGTVWSTSLTPDDEPVTTYAGTSSGGISTDSSFGNADTRDRLNDNSPDITNASSPTGAIEWSDSASSGLELYLKPTAAKELQYIDLALDTGYGDPISSVAFTDDGDTTISILDAPADINDNYQTTTSGTQKWYRWELYSSANNMRGAISASMAITQTADAVLAAPAGALTWEINIPLTTDWVGIYEIRITGHDDTEWFAALTGVDEPANELADISAGEFCVDSAYGTINTQDYLDDGTPDITVPTSATGNPQWSDSGTSGLKIFIKTPSGVQKSFKYLDIASSQVYADHTQLVTVTNRDTDTALTINTRPADDTDVYQTTTNANVNWHRYSFSATAWSISGFTYNSGLGSLDVTTELTDPKCFDFANGGTYLYVASNNSIERYTCSTPYDPNTASYDTGQTFSWSGSGAEQGIWVSDDGSELLVGVGGTGDEVRRYTFGTNYNVTTLTHQSADDLDISSDEGNCTGLTVVKSGSTYHLYVIGQNGDEINWYTNSTTTPSGFTLQGTLTGLDATPAGIYVSPDGSKVLYCGKTAGKVFQLNMRDSFDITTAVAEADFVTSATLTSEEDVFYDEDNDIVWVLDSSPDTITAWN